MGIFKDYCRFPTRLKNKSEVESSSTRKVSSGVPQEAMETCARSLSSAKKIGHTRRKFRAFQRISLAGLVVLFFLFFYPPPAFYRPVSRRQLATTSCNLLPDMLIVVLTATREHSLARLLDSLIHADYGCAKIDLQINVDSAPTVGSNEGCVNVAAEIRWPHGTKTVFRRLLHAGLSQSWFETSYSGSHDYLAIFEDDMQVSPHFFKFVNMLHQTGAMDSATAICLYPNDWEVDVKIRCNNLKYSPYLYFTPEPCNWGPVWKSVEWRKYIDWVFAMKEDGELPFVPEEVAHEYNEYLRAGKDVQSSWVWRYNFDTGKRQLRYSFTKCSTDTMAYHSKHHKGVVPSGEVFLAINHKEPGEHFSRKFDGDTDSRKLKFDFDALESNFRRYQNSFTPHPFGKYLVDDHIMGN